MSDKTRGDDQGGQGKPVRDLLHQGARGPKSRRGDIGTTVVVDDDSDGDVDDGHQRLADDEGSCVVARLAHLGHDGEEGRCAGVSEDQRRQGGGGGGEAWVLDELVIGDEDALLRSSGWAVLDSYGYGD